MPNNVTGHAFGFGGTICGLGFSISSEGAAGMLAFPARTILQFGVQAFGFVDLENPEDEQFVGIPMWLGPRPIALVLQVTDNGGS